MRALRVLIVEDGASATSEEVRRLGHIALTAPGMAVDRWATWNPDAILVDLAASNIDGIELAKRVRQTANTPLVAITGFMDVERHRQAVDAGYDAFLAKPFRLEELAEILIRVEARIVESKAIADRTRLASEATRALNRKAREGLAEYREWKKPR